MSSFQFIYSGSDTRKITRLNNDPVIISGDSNSTTFSFKFPESHKGYKKTIEWDFWIKDPEGNLMNPSYPLVNDEHIIPGEVTYLNSGKLVGFSLIFESDDDPLFRERSAIYPIYISKGVKITENLSIFDTLMQEIYITSAKVEEHTSDVDNPHSVTKAQVGLGNVSNLAPADLGISTATQTALNAKQDKLTFDSTPLYNSNNPVTSRGIYSAIDANNGEIVQHFMPLINDFSAAVDDITDNISALSTGKQDKLTFDSAPTTGSANPVTSGGVKTAWDLKASKTEVNSALALKADKTEVNNSLALKADITYVDTEIAGIDVAPPIATEAEAIEGTDDTKMMTPLKVQRAVDTNIDPIISTLVSFSPEDFTHLLPPVDCTELLTMYKGDTTIIESPAINAKNCIGLEEVFRGCTNLKRVGYIHMPNVISMYGMFRECSSLTTIPVLDTSKVTNMKNMFYGCSSLTSTPPLDVSNVSNMENMFRECSSLTSVAFIGDVVPPYGYLMFWGTPIASGNGYIFVPDNLVQAYRTAESWSAHASVIYGHSDKESMTSQVQQMAVMNVKNKPSEAELQLMMQRFDEEELN